MIVKQFDICKMKEVSGLDITLSPSELFSDFITALYEGGVKVEIKNSKSAIKVIVINGCELQVIIRNITYLGNPHDLDKKRIQNNSNYEKNIDVKKPLLIIGRYGYSNGNIWTIWEKSSKTGGKNAALHVNVRDFENGYVLGKYTRFDARNNSVTTFKRWELKNIVVNTIDKFKSKTMDASQMIAEKIWEIIGSDTEWVATEKYQMMKNAQFKNWKQQQWQGFYLEYLAEKSKNIETPGPKILSTKWDSIIDEHIVDLKVHTYVDGKNEVLGNDYEAVKETVKRYGKLYYAVVIGEAVMESDSKEITKFWNDLKGKLSKAQLKNIEDGKKHKKLKKIFTVKEVEVIEINSINLDTFKKFQEGFTNTGGTKRNAKIKPILKCEKTR